MRLFGVVNRNLSTLTLTLLSDVPFPCLLSLQDASSTHIITLTVHETRQLVYKLNFPDYISFLPFEETVQPSPSKNVLLLRLNAHSLINLPDTDVIQIKPHNPVDPSVLDDWIFCHNHEHAPSPAPNVPSRQGDDTERLISSVEEVTSFILSQPIGSLCILESGDKYSNLIVKILSSTAISFMCNLTDESFDQVGRSGRNVSLSPSTICLVQFKSLSGTCSNELAELKQYRRSFFVEWIKVAASTFTEISNLLSDSIKATLVSVEKEQNDEQSSQAKMKERQKNEPASEKEEQEEEEEEEEKKEEVVSSAVEGDDEKSSRGHRQVKCNSSTADDSSDDTAHATPVSCIESTSLLPSRGVVSCPHSSNFSTGFLFLSSSPTRATCSSSSFIT